MNNLISAFISLIEITANTILILADEHRSGFAVLVDEEVSLAMRHNGPLFNFLDTCFWGRCVRNIHDVIWDSVGYQDGCTIVSALDPLLPSCVNLGNHGDGRYRA